jgi:ectoine hydroxylase-related dioxygenase (phytanoyl-CoA dioxygenase family)
MSATLHEDHELSQSGQPVASASLQRLPNTATVEEVTSVLDEHGYVIIDELVSGDTMDRIVEEMQLLLDASEHGDEYFSGTKTRRTGRLMANSPTARELVMNPLVLGVGRSFLSAAPGIQLGSTEVISIEPGQTAQILHIDDMVAGEYPYTPDFKIYCNNIWAVTDVTEENGGTRVVPGSHKKQFEEQNYTQDDTVAVEMKKGSLLIFSGKLVHGGGANTTTDEVRRALSLPYIVSWMRQEENQYLACPQKIARTLPDDLLRVMGYDAIYGMGHAGALSDPLPALFED